MGYELADGSVSIEYKVGDVFEYAEGVEDDEKAYFFRENMSKELTLHDDDETFCPKFKDEFSNTGYEDWELLVPKKTTNQSFTKKDLVPGEHIVVTGNGDNYLVLGGGILLEVLDGGWIPLDGYGDDLVYEDGDEFTINEVYSFKKEDCLFSINSSKFRTLVWERKEEKKEWYHNIPEGGVLCWVSDEGDVEDRLRLIVSWHGSKQYKFLSNEYCHHQYARPVKPNEVNFAEE